MHALIRVFRARLSAHVSGLRGRMDRFVSTERLCTVGQSWPVPSLAPQEWVSCVFLLCFRYRFFFILALPRQLFSYVARLNRLFSSGGAPFSWPCRACNAHEKPRCGGYGGYIWESLLPRTMTGGTL